MRIMIDLPGELFRQAEAQAAQDGTTVERLIMLFMEQGLSQQTALPGKHRIHSKLPVARAASDRPLPGLSNADLFRLLDET